MTLSQILADVELGEEVVSQGAVDLSLLEDNQAATVAFDASPFGHKQAFTVAFTPKSPTPATQSASKPSSLDVVITDIELAEEVATQVAADLAGLQSGTAISSSFDATLFGHPYGVAISSVPASA